MSSRSHLVVVPAAHMDARHDATLAATGDDSVLDFSITTWPMIQQWKGRTVCMARRRVDRWSLRMRSLPHWTSCVMRDLFYVMRDLFYMRDDACSRSSPEGNHERWNAIFAPFLLIWKRRPAAIACCRCVIKTSQSTRVPLTKSYIAPGTVIKQGE
jgi:hypothetical protein